MALRRSIEQWRSTVPVAVVEGSAGASIEVRDIDLPAEEMPLCPLCDQPLFGGEGLVVGKLNTPHGQLYALVHRDCVDEEHEPTGGSYE